MSKPFSFLDPLGRASIPSVALLTTSSLLHPNSSQASLLHGSGAASTLAGGNVRSALAEILLAPEVSAAVSETVLRRERLDCWAVVVVAEMTVERERWRGFAMGGG